MTVHFTTRDQDLHLGVAATLTNSKGWMADAHAIAAYSQPVKSGVYVSPDALIGIMVFQNRTTTSADMHIGLMDGHRLTKGFLTSLLTIAFHPRMCGYDKLLCYIPEINRFAQGNAVHLGFDFEARIRGGSADGGDAILMTMTRQRALPALPATELKPADASVEKVN